MAAPYRSTCFLIVLLCVSPTISTFLPCFDVYLNRPTHCSPPVQTDIAQGITPIATSTCGSNGPEEICSIGSIHSCDVCPDPDTYPASSITDGLTNTHWRSQTYSFIRDGVNVSLSLGKTHYIRKISLTFEGPRPESFAVYVSGDGGVSHTPLQYFSQSCQETYGRVNCVTGGTGITPLSGGLATLSIPSNSDPVVASDILLRLDRLSTLGNELTWSDDSQKSYSYAISSMTVEGGCFCNGHADSCDVDQFGDSFCVCQHNTTGRDCEMCLSSHNNQPWQESVFDEDSAFSCKVCNCNGRSDECIFDANVYLQSGNTTGGVCINCQYNTAGNACQKCAEGFYPFNPTAEDLNCTACICDPRGVMGGDGTCLTATSIYSARGSSCPCKSNVDGATCGTCKPGYHSLFTNNSEGCQECNCNEEGSVIGTDCDEVTGNCICKPGYYGQTCQPCNCHPNGTYDDSLECDGVGKCECKNGFGGDKCDTCLSGYYDFLDGCKPCNCHYSRSVNSSCDIVTGQCYCDPGFSGSDCSVCPDGYHNVDLVCTECPDCYQSIARDFSTTESLLMELILQTNISLSSLVFHEDLISTVDDIRESLTQLLELVKNLSRREILLASAVNHTSVSLDVKIARLTGYSAIVRQALVNSKIALDTANTTRNEVDILSELFASSRLELMEIEENITRANQILANIILLRLDLIAIANQSDALSIEQSDTINRLRVQSNILFDNTTEALASICEAVENENTTLVHSQSIRNCTLPDLDELLVIARDRLQNAIDNSSKVLNDSILIHDEVLRIVIPDYNENQLLNASENSLKDAEQLTINIESLANETSALKSRFNYINTTIEELSDRIEYLDSTATDLTERARDALSLANTSAISAEVVIEETQLISEELARRLDEILEFLQKYNDLLMLVQRAENISEDAVDKSNEQLNEMQRVMSVVVIIDGTLQRAMDTLTTAMNIVQQANVTALTVLSNAQAINATLQDIPDEIKTTEERISLLEERASKDQATIEAAESVTSITAERVNSLEQDLLEVNNLITQLENDINNVTLVPESRYMTLKRNVNSLEAAIDRMEQNIETVDGEVTMLQEQSDILESKYTELRRHKDLLDDIKSEIQGLSCADNVN